ncbi:hypothetical protein JW887_04105 [Candidatus Dojkabacteria bacterium]|nr:hypothetical protein [Candidatus Dojkabacteria bacterium]
MNKYIIDVIDRNDNITSFQHYAKNEGDARITFRANDTTLCRNSFVILENVPSYTSQILKIIHV